VAALAGCDRHRDGRVCGERSQVRACPVTKSPLS
jgi:hypothetical protein